MRHSIEADPNNLSSMQHDSVVDESSQELIMAQRRDSQRRKASGGRNESNKSTDYKQLNEELDVKDNLIQ